MPDELRHPAFDVWVEGDEVKLALGPSGRTSYTVVVVLALGAAIDLGERLDAAGWEAARE